MAAPLILARTFKDAHSYAQDVLGLSIGYYRVVNSPGTIKAVRGRELHLVPGWDKRPDRFSMRSAIRFCRNTVIDVAAEPAAPADPRGDLTERQLEVAHRYNALLDTSNGDNMVAEGSPVTTDFFDEPEVAEETATCVDCGLDEHAEDCPQAPAPTPEPAPEKPKKARRRSRCKECGNLHYKEDPCPEGDE